MLNKLVSGVLLGALTVSLISPGTTAEAAKKTSLKQTKITVLTGKTKKIQIKNKTKKRKYVFSSSKKKIASVTKNGVVRGKKAGKAVITVKEMYQVKKKKKKKVIGKVKVTVKKKTVPVRKTPVPAPNPTALPSVTPGANPPVVSHGPAPDVKIEPTFYVSADGDDGGDGSRSHPFRTLARAKEAVRGLDKSKGDIVVEIADGFYPVEDTIVFDSKDSGTEQGTVIYRAAKGATPVFSGGKKLEGKWQKAEDVNWLRDGVTAYKVPLERSEKLRAIYVNGERASMTSKSQKPAQAIGSYTVAKGQAEWAWAPSTTKIYTGAVFSATFGLPADTRNPQNIELESGSTWAQQLVCAESLSLTEEGDTQVNLQMPYGALAQNLGWGTAYSPTKSNDVTNVFEWLEKPGEFYFDQAGSMLYYIPRKGEDINSAEVIIPETDTIIDMCGDKPTSDYVQNITFDGLGFAYTDWNLYELEGSHGYASVQGSIVLTKFANVNQHDDIYRSYDVPPAAIHINSAKNVRFLNGEIRHTGYLGAHLENDVWDCEVTGNYIAHTGGAGIVVGHPQHVYENDTEIHHVKANNAAGPEKEKFQDGTESVPKNITITNNYLYENCYFFPGNSPITSFFTYNMQVLHNFVYKCSYSGMSIGWGWCNFDGETGSDSQLPGVPTDTSKNNHVNYNRVEEICSLLQDAGGIYTLGKQGNDDWTEYSEMSFNYINAKRKKQTANGSKMINGFHPDEGSAYIKFDSNVVTNIIRNVYELNDWRRKHDMIVTNGFSNTDRSETTAPNCTLDQYVNEQYIWPLKGYETVLYSGLEDDYVYMVGQDVIPDTDYELAANVRLAAGQKLPRRGLLQQEDEVWLAKEGTSSFAESDVMTKAAGNEKTMDIPKEAGEYKLYIRYADGSVSSASTFTLYVGEASDIANVSEGQNVNVSKIRPLVLELSADYSYMLNGKAIENGYEISTAGTWTLKANSETIVFTTSVTEANQILDSDITVGSGEEFHFSSILSDGTKTIWLAPSGLSAFDEKDPTMSKAAGDSSSMKAPIQPGRYILTIVDSKGGILSQSDAFVTVE
ncbi:MAG: hypothetical protein HFG37_03340 [Eubacterium sp.]|nr:hypothetical protein [Eubacterium sp.]